MKIANQLLKVLLFETGAERLERHTIRWPAYYSPTPRTRPPRQNGCDCKFDLYTPQQPSKLAIQTYSFA